MPEVLTVRDIVQDREVIYFGGQDGAGRLFVEAERHRAGGARLIDDRSHVPMAQHPVGGSGRPGKQAARARLPVGFVEGDEAAFAGVVMGSPWPSRRRARPWWAGG